MTAVAEKKVVIGRLGRPFGLEGWQHIQSFTNPKENILNYKNWLIEDPKLGWKNLKVVAIRPQNKGFVARLEGITVKEQASLYSNLKIAISRTQLTKLPEGQFYWADLEGLNAQTKQGVSLGTVQYLYDNSGLDVVVIKGRDKERHIPFLWQDTVLDIDFIEDMMTLDWDFDVS